MVNEVKIIELINTPLIVVDGRQYAINSLTRKRKVVFARFVVFEFLHSKGYTLDQVGDLFDVAGTQNRMNHATILNGIRELRNMLESPYKTEDLHLVKAILDPILHNECYDEPEKKMHELSELERAIIDASNYADFRAIRKKVILSII